MARRLRPCIALCFHSKQTSPTTHSMRPVIRSANRPRIHAPFPTATPRHASSAPYTASTFIRDSDHTPKTPNAAKETYVLTLHTDAAHHAEITALRAHYFPTQFNKLPAHLALFHVLPGSHLKTIESDIFATCQRHQPFSISTREPFLLFRGVGLHVEAAPAMDIHTSLREKRAGILRKTDRNFRSHYTIQNKVGARESRETMRELQQRLKGGTGEVDGLALWRSSWGCWLHTKDFLFPLRTETET